MTAHALGLVGRRVLTDIDEPSYFAAVGGNELTGTIRRVVKQTPRAGLEFLVAFVELDEPIVTDSRRYDVFPDAWIWQGGQARVISLMARHVGWELTNLNGREIIGVNINWEPEWVLECAENDLRLRSGLESKNIGYGSAKLID